MQAAENRVPEQGSRGGPGWRILSAGGAMIARIVLHPDNREEIIASRLAIEEAEDVRKQKSMLCSAVA
jgi:hypothetical protein